MSVQLTCAIVRDLLPSYVEGLASGETRAAVEEHLASCPDCARLRDELAAPVAEIPAGLAEETAREVDYLKKVKRRGWRRVGLAILATALLIALGLAAKVFIIGTPAQEQELTAWFREENGVLILSASTPYSATAYWGWDVEREGDTAYVTARSVLVSPLFRKGGGSVEIPMEGLKKVYLCGRDGRLVWQEGVEIRRNAWLLYERKTPYVGDAPAVGRLAEALGAQGLGSYTNSVRTSERPYRWTMEFSDIFSGAAEERLNREMTIIAWQMLALVGNLDEFAWTYTVPGGETKEQVFTVSDADEQLPALAEEWNQRNGESRPAPAGIKSCADSPAAVQRLRELLECLDLGLSLKTEIVQIPPEERAERQEGAYIFVN